MLDWFQQVIRCSIQQRLKEALVAHPYWAYVSVVFFVAGLVHLFVQLMFESFTLSLLFTLASVAVGSFLFTVKVSGKQDWLTGSWFAKTCIDIWKHDHNEE